MNKTEKVPALAAYTVFKGQTRNKDPYQRAQSFMIAMVVIKILKANLVVQSI